MVVDGLVEGAQLLFELGGRGARGAASRPACRRLLVLSMGHRHVLADRAHGGIEDLVLDVLVDLEVAGEEAHHVAALRVVGRHRIDPLEEAQHQLVVLEGDRVGLAGGTRSTHVNAATSPEAPTRNEVCTR